MSSMFLDFLSAVLLEDPARSLVSLGNLGTSDLRLHQCIGETFNQDS